MCVFPDGEKLVQPPGVDRHIETRDPNQVLCIDEEVEPHIFPVRRLRPVIPLTVGLFLLLLPTPSAGANDGLQSRDAVIRQYQSVLLPTLQIAPNWTGSLGDCVAGQTSSEYQQATLTALNYMRGMVNLPPVSLDASMNAVAQPAALMMAAQRSLSHEPPSSWACWSPQGLDGARRSNLALGSSGPSAILAYMADRGANNRLVGHRRWLLDSEAVVMGTGDTGSSNALTVIGGPRRSSPGTWIPWPAAGYFPWQLEPNGRWSLGLPGANFGNATVNVSIDGNSVPVSVTPPFNGYGDNTISWDMSLPRAESGSGRNDMSVDVSVAGIGLGDGRVISHSYRVTLVDAEPATLPSPAEIRSVRRVGSSILVAFDPISESGREAVSYIARARPISGKGARSLPTRTCTSNGGLCRITRVRPNVTYEISLITRNSAGDCEASLARAVRR